MLNHWQRIIAYLTGCIVIGLAIVVFTHSFFQYANAPGTQGYLTLFGFGLAFLNLSFIVNRRFMLKSDHTHLYNYLFSLMIIAPTLLWVFTKDEGLGDSFITFVLTVIFAAFLGTYFGIRRGIARRRHYWETQAKYEDEEMPEGLKRPHDDLSKN